jgi:hypothetical protein
MLRLPNSNDGLFADVEVLKYNGIQGSTVKLYAVVFGSFGESFLGYLPPFPILQPLFHT